MNTVILKLVNSAGESSLIRVPADTQCITTEIIDDKRNHTVKNVISINDKEAAPGSCDTTVIVDNIECVNVPRATLNVGKMDSEGYLWQTGAMLFSTTNGRIIGVNNTPGYAATHKPLATKPWTRRVIRTNGYKSKLAID